MTDERTGLEQAIEESAPGFARMLAEREMGDEALREQFERWWEKDAGAHPGRARTLRRENEYSTDPMSREWRAFVGSAALATPPAPRPDTLEWVVRQVLNTFLQAESNGAHTKDRRYAIDMLQLGLTYVEAPPPSPAPTHEEFFEELFPPRPIPAPRPTSDDARDTGLLFDPLQRMEHGDGRYGPRFLEIVEEGWERSQVDALAGLFGLELRFIAAGTGIDPGADDWTFGAALAAVTQPNPGDGWQLVGVHDDEDAEIVFEFVRAAIARQAAGGAE